MSALDDVPMILTILGIPSKVHIRWVTDQYRQQEKEDQTGGESVGMQRGGARVGVTSDTLRREEMRGSRGVIVVAITVV